MPSREYEKNLLYLNPGLHPRDIVDSAINRVFSNLARVETKGTEKNIPKKGKLVIGFIPHSGTLETLLIDEILERMGRKPAVILTKEETKDIPEALLSIRRLIYVDREKPQPSSIKTVKRVLETEDGTICTALEGTRFSNPNDEYDVLTLGKVRQGVIRFAYDAQAPILGVVILGTDKILPRLDKIVKERGIQEAVFLVANAYINPVDVQVRFLLYKDHITNGEANLKGKEKHNFINFHEEQLVKQLINKLLKIEPNYPLGYYEKI